MVFKVLSILSCLLFCSHYTRSLDVVDCGSYFLFEDIQLEGCDEDDTTCPLYIGSTMNISFTLSTGKRYGTFNIDADLINDVAFYVTGGPRFNLTVTPVNPCEVLRCPLDVNYSAKYSAYIYVDTKYQPIGSAVLQWVLQTAKERENLLCFRFPVTVQY